MDPYAYLYYHHYQLMFYPNGAMIPVNPYYEPQDELQNWNGPIIEEIPEDTDPVKMFSSGPLLPSDLPDQPVYPSPIIVPLDFIEDQTKMGGFEVEEDALYIMSKAVEEFIKQLMRRTTSNGEKPFTYDEMAKYIQGSEFKVLKERVRYGDILAELASQNPDPPSTTPVIPSSSSNSNIPCTSTDVPH